MSFQALNQVLGNLQGHYKHQEQKQLPQVLRSWPEVVGPIVAAQTQPLSLQRGVLKVATSSSAWAQNLVFERQRILDKLNRVLTFQIDDIRFSPAQWHQSQPTTVFPGAKEQTDLWQSHPSRIETQESNPPTSNQPPLHPTSITGMGANGSEANATETRFTDPMTAFANWATQMRSQTKQLPLCPDCKCPTPHGELKRWQVCSLCAAKQWGSKF
jgi:predicted nucleic acid-binding Zn ribbon protein